MSVALLQVCVVGHTNTGKTTLLRTLSRDTGFGEVRDAPSTTRHVEGTQILVDGEPVMDLYDTPGLEDASGILDWIDREQGQRHTGSQTLERFLESPDASQRFEQECKVLRQLRTSDVGLYVIDVREPVLGKYRDELAVLSLCARPLLPLLNFVASPDSRESEWREALGRLGLHAVISLDSVVYVLDDELRLYEKLRSMLDSHREPLGRLMEARSQEARWLERAAAEIVADMLLDVASHTLFVEADDERMQGASQQLQERIRRREQQCVDALLELYRFRPDDYLPSELPLENGRWGLDLFTSEAMLHYGLRTGEGAAVGGLIGLAVDVMALGTTLGAGTVVGAATGAVVGNTLGLGKRLLRRLRGRQELRADDNTLRLLALRGQRLAAALSRRGHGADRAMQLDPLAQDVWRKNRLPEMLLQARLKPGWSRLDPDAADLESGARLRSLEALTEHLLKTRTR